MLSQSFPTSSPFHQLHCYEVIAVSTVEEDEAVGRGGFELEEEVHGGVGLQGGQAQVAGLGLEGHRVGDDGSHAEAGVELAEVDVAVLAQVNVEQAIELEALQVPDEAGRDDGDKAPLCHHARLNVVELQARVVARHLTCKPRDKVNNKRQLNNDNNCCHGTCT